MIIRCKLPLLATVYRNDLHLWAFGWIVARKFIAAKTESTKHDHSISKHQGVVFWTEKKRTRICRRGRARATSFRRLRIFCGTCGCKHRQQAAENQITNCCTEHSERFKQNIVNINRKLTFLHRSQTPVLVVKALGTGPWFVPFSGHWAWTETWREI